MVATFKPLPNQGSKASKWAHVEGETSDVEEADVGGNLKRMEGGAKKWEMDGRGAWIELAHHNQCNQGRRIVH